MTALEIDLMTLNDLDEIMVIEHLCFPTPWSRFAFQIELEQNHFGLYVVGREAGRIVAYAGAWIVLDEAHITNIAVHPDFRGRGYGEAILLALLRRVRARGARRATLEVRENNRVAQQLYLKHGFEFQGRRRGYYTDTGEDALIMWKNDLTVLSDTL
ncbi:MAG: ribosomal protein S18-alanine N-acetyltransferase [Bacillota bacterium]|jgi:ribosomal-protein-alanine N-acetyltransferase